MKTWLIWSLLFLNYFAFAGMTVPDFTMQIGRDETVNCKCFLLNFLAPTGFHVNADAPMKVTSPDPNLKFEKLGANLEHAGFRASGPSLENGKAHAELYLCDDQKTVCVKKSLDFQIALNSDIKHLDFPKDGGSEKSSPKKSKSKKSATDAEGFWNNEPEAAIAEAVRLKKPLFIDFYGIWCPPCNLYNETVFPKTAFKQATKNWVLLKMDADSPASFELKSHFKIGGYPTLVEVKVPTTSDVSTLGEIDRIVGYYPLSEFLPMLNQAYANRNLSLDEKLIAQKNVYLKTLKDAIAVRLEQKDSAGTLALCESGEKVSDDHFFPLNALSVRANDKPEVLKEKAATDLISSVWTHRKQESTETLLKYEDLITSKNTEFSKTQIASVFEVLDELATRVDPGTLTIPNVEISIADVDSMRVDVAEALDDAALTKKACAQAASSYQKMITQFHLEESRGMNLEFAYYLYKSGSIDQAKTIYSKFIKKYPEEFTFYYAASKMYLDLKDLTEARTLAEKAVKYAYGDNKLRSAERLVRVMSAQGEKDQAVKRGTETLSELPAVKDDLQVRTNRYVKALKKAIDDAQKGTS